MKIFKLTIITMFVMSLSAYSQRNTMLVTDFNITDWTKIEQINGVEFSYKVEDCHDIKNGIHKKLVLLQITNTTNEKMQVSWINKLWYNNISLVNDLENSATKVLEAGETIEGSCDNRGGKLVLHLEFLNYTDKPKLTKFILKQITVNPL